MSEEQEPFIEVQDLHQRFGRQHVLRGVNLQVYRGETLCLLGGSGGGKTGGGRGRAMRIFAQRSLVGSTASLPRLTLHIGVGAGNITLLQVGGTFARYD